jgi:hypothetical protein
MLLSSETFFTEKITLQKFETLFIWREFLEVITEMENSFNSSKQSGKRDRRYSIGIGLLSERLIPYTKSHWYLATHSGIETLNRQVNTEILEEEVKSLWKLLCIANV